MISGLSLCSMDSYIQIAITIINAAIMTWLGINQYKLQKRETEAQEYEIYKRLYSLLIKVHTEVNGFLDNVSFGTWKTYYDTNKESLKIKEKFINQLKTDLLNDYLDYELKFSGDLFDKEAYRQILSTMSTILYQINQAIDNNDIDMPIGSHRIYPVDGDKDVGMAVAIAKRFKDADMMLNGLMYFINQKRQFGKCHDALKTIKKKCKIY